MYRRIGTKTVLKPISLRMPGPGRKLSYFWLSCKNASCIDPYDRTWCPEDGWTYLWEFKTLDELDNFANRYKRYATVEKDYLRFYAPGGTYGDVNRTDDPLNYRKIAICSRITVEQSTTRETILASYIEKGRYYAILRTVAGDTSKLQLYIFGNGTCSFNNPGDWFVTVMDFDNMVMKAFNRSREELASIAIVGNYSFSSSLKSEIVIYEYRTSDRKWRIKVDWIAVKL